MDNDEEHWSSDAETSSSGQNQNPQHNSNSEQASHDSSSSSGGCSPILQWYNSDNNAHAQKSGDLNTQKIFEE